MSLERSGRMVVSASWFQPLLAIPWEERNATVLEVTSTRLVASHEVSVAKLSIARIETITEFFSDRPPKISARWSPLADSGVTQLAWFVVSNDKVIRYGSESYLEFGNLTTRTAVSDDDSEVEVGDPSMASGKEAVIHIDWSDSPRGTKAYAGPISTPWGNQSGVIFVFEDGLREVDPTVFAQSSSSTATAYSSQRKVLWTGDRYWVFYQTSTDIVYRTTVDGTSWAPARTAVSGIPASGFDVDSQG
ncbi:MAG: hypothetical protein ACREDF_05980, partial [Thermoplasmata archaeon]